MRCGFSLLRNLLLYTLVVACVSSCDFLAKEDAPSDDPSLITAAKTFLVVDRPNLTSAAWGTRGDGFDPGVLKARRPPDWSTARVLRGRAAPGLWWSASMDPP